MAYLFVFLNKQHFFMSSSHVTWSLYRRSILYLQFSMLMGSYSQTYTQNTEQVICPRLIIHKGIGV